MNVNKSQVDSRAKQCHGMTLQIGFSAEACSQWTPWWTLTYASFDAQNLAIQFFLFAHQKFKLPRVPQEAVKMYSPSY